MLTISPLVFRPTHHHSKLRFQAYCGIFMGIITRFTTILWHFGNGAPTPRPKLVISRDTSISEIAYLPDGRLVTGSHRGIIRIWNLQSGKQEGTSIEQENGVQRLAVTRDGAKIISGGFYGQIEVWDVESHKLLKAWTHQGIRPMIALSSDDQLIAVSGSQLVGIYTAEGEQVNSIEVGTHVCSLSFSPDGNKLACGTEKDILIYDVNTGTLVLHPLKGHENWIWSVLWSRDGSRLFSASNDKTIRCWDSNTGEQIGHPWTGHTDFISSLSLSPDGTLLASSSFDKTVRFWDTTLGCPVGQHLQHDTSVYSVCFSPSGEFVVPTVCHGNTNLWRVPRLDSSKSQVMTLIRSPSLSTLIVLYIQKMSFASSDAPSHTLFLPPPPYSTHIPSAEQTSDPGPGVCLNSSWPRAFLMLTLL